MHYVTNLDALVESPVIELSENFFWTYMVEPLVRNRSTPKTKFSDFWPKSTKRAHTKTQMLSEFSKLTVEFFKNNRRMVALLHNGQAWLVNFAIGV